MAKTIAVAGRWTVTAMACLILANCAAPFGSYSSRKANKYGVSASPRVVNTAGPIDPAIKHRGMAMVGKPYTVAGKVYVPKDDPSYRAVGTASWYGDDFHGRLTANGEVYDMYDLSAAHATMPLPSYARVTNLRNGRSLVVRVNDRGPYHPGRVIDVSSRAADLLDFRHDGIGEVKVEYLGRASVRGADQQMLLATLRTDGSAAPLPGPAANVMLAEAPLPPPRVPDAVMQASFVPADQPVLPAAAAVPFPPDRSLDLGTVPNADMPVPRPPLERQAAADAEPTLRVADIVAGPEPSRAVAFAPQPIDRAKPMFVGAGVYADRGNAERLAARLSAGASVRVDPIEREGRTLWRVRAGPYESPEAVALARQLAREAGAGDTVLLP